jgi:hypothetical protein
VNGKVVGALAAAPDTERLASLASIPVQSTSTSKQPIREEPAGVAAAGASSELASMGQNHDRSCGQANIGTVHGYSPSPRKNV